jgi:outer membrane receptor protein involved in Fe transport
MTLRFLVRHACAAALVLMLNGVATAQVPTTTIGGRVTDPQQAPAPDATVTVRSEATGVTWTAVTGADGRFTVPMLPPGVYTAEVQKSGFSTWRTEGIVLQVGQDRQLEAQLAVGAVQEIVNVSQAVRVVTTAVDGVLSAETIQSLPLNGRNFLELALLVPGTAPTPLFDPTKTNSVLIAGAGSMGRGTNVTIDGQNNNDDVVGGPLINLPIDAVQEFQIATNRFGADLGRSASSVINVVTRSGGNATQGSLSIFARDGAWQSVPATYNSSDPTPPFDRQQVSGAVGGALKRDRVFYFGAVEYRDQSGGVLVGTRNTATQTITRSFAPAPLKDSLWTFRVDTGGSTNRVTARYAGEWAKDTAPSAIDRAIGSATQRQEAMNRYHSVLGTWTAAPRASFVNAFNVSLSTYLNSTDPVASVPQLTFPSIQDGASFRMPQETLQRRLQISDSATLSRGAHILKFGGELQRIDGEFRLGVFRQGRIELVEDFPTFDHNGDGRVDDNDLLFAVTLRSGKPTQNLNLPDSDNTHVSGFVQDDWSLSNNVQLNLGLRYELDTQVNNQGRVDELNPLILPFVNGERKRDTNNFGPRVGLAWNVGDSGLIVRGGYGIYYDRIVLQIQSLERGLDGRALPIEVRAGNVFFLDPQTGRFPPIAPTISNPFTGFILPGAGASGINIIDSRLRNPKVQEFHVGLEKDFRGANARVDVVHNEGTDFLIGRTVGQVFNPVVGGPDRVVNIESSAETKYDALMLSMDRRLSGGHSFRASYTLAKAFNYVNDDQIPFSNGPIDPNDLRREYGPTPNDRRHRFVVSGQVLTLGKVSVSALWTASSGVPMDILMPDAQSRVPVLQRNAGGRQFKTAGELNSYLTQLNAGGGVNGVLLPLVPNDAKFNDTFSSLDLRVSRPFALTERVRLEPMLEVFNLFDTTNILGLSVVNYSGFSNVLVRDSETPGTPGYLTSSRFGRPVSTAGGVFGSGGPRAMQLAARLTF